MRFYHSIFVIIAVCALILAFPGIAGAVVDNTDSLVVPTGETYTLGGEHSYDMLVKVESGGTLYVTTYSGGAATGNLTLQAPDIVVSGTIDGSGRGFRGQGNYQEGPGIGGYPGGGAGYGGAGGASSYGGPGGPAYGTSGGREIQKGSGGGDGSGGLYGGGNGGAAISLIAVTLSVSGSVTTDGTYGTNPTWGSGGGSGGGVYLQAPNVTVTGVLSAKGGNGSSGSSWFGGGGGGGRIKIIHCSLIWGGTYTVSGGAAGGGSASSGNAGTYSTQVMPEPVITSIVDVENDQGRQVRVAWTRSCSDNVSEFDPVTHYTIWRRIDDLSKGMTATAVMQIRSAYPPGNWDYVAEVPARGEDEYNMVVPTLADSNSTGQHWSTFFISGVTANPFIYYDSNPDSGYSVDNLAPAEPSPFTAKVINAETHLEWGENAEADFHACKLHRGTSEGFIPGPSNLLTTQASTDYVDQGPTGGFYKLAAIDFNGNVSSYALVTPGETVGIPGGSAPTLSLSAASPTINRITVQFSLPGNDRASLSVFDIRGRVAIQRDVTALGRGRHTLNLGGRSDLSSGVYFVRLIQGDDARIVRSIVIR